MNREILIVQTIKKIQQLPDHKIQEINDFVDFLLNRLDETILQEGIQKITAESKSFEYLKNDEDLYSVKRLKRKV